MKRSTNLSGNSKPSNGTQYPETVEEFGHLEPVCQVCGKPLEQGQGLVTYSEGRQHEIDRKRIRVTCKGRCDDGTNRFSREADWVFANLPERKEETL